MSVNAERYSKIANLLNRDAWEKQNKGRPKPPKQFFPCEKALVLTAAIGARKVTYEVIPVAAITLCDCHPGLDEKALWAMYDQAGKAGENV